MKHLKLYENFEKKEDKPLRIDEIDELKKLKIGIKPGEIRSREDPKENGMPLCYIYKDKEILTTIYGKNQEEISNKVVVYLRDYLKNDK